MGRLEIKLNHVAPVAGLVGFSVEEVKGIPDVFGPEGVAERKVILEEDILFTNH